MLEVIFILNETSNKNPMITYKTETNQIHLSLLKKFAHDYNLNISDIEKLTSYELSIILAQMGYINIHVEGMNMLIYLPKILSDNQYKWFKDNRTLLSRFTLLAASIQEDDSVKYIEKDEDEVKSNMNRLYRELKKKEMLKKRITLEEQNSVKKI